MARSWEVDWKGEKRPFMMCVLFNIIYFLSSSLLPSIYHHHHNHIFLKALVDRQLLPCLPLSKPLRKILLGKPVGLNDLRLVGWLVGCENKHHESALQSPLSCCFF